MEIGLQRAKSKLKKHKKALWSENQKLQAVSTYLMLGSMPQVSLVTSIPLITLKVWKTKDWWKEYALQLKTEDVQELSANMQRIVNKALKTVEDRIDLGDAQFDQKTGAIVRVPIKAHVALKITTELLQRKEKLEQDPLKEQVEKTIDQRLLKLSEEFARFANSKVIDVVPVEKPIEVPQL